MSKKNLTEIGIDRFRFLKRKKYLFIILGTYVFLWFLYAYFFLYSHQWPKTRAYFNKIGDGFAVSFSASLLDDLIVFIALTLVVIILTTKSLDDYSFNEKVAAIINNQASTNLEGLHAYLHTSISRLLAYDNHVSYKITVNDYNAHENAFMLYFDIEFQIKNMCRDKDFIILEDYNFYVYKSDTNVNGEHGYVTLFTTQNSADDELVTHIDETKKFTLDKRFEWPLDIRILKDQQLKVHLKYNVWSKTGQAFDKETLNLWNFLQSVRYVENVDLLIKNQLEHDLKFDIYTNKKQSNGKNALSLKRNGVISKDGFFRYKNTEGLYPHDDIRVYFHKL